MKSQRECYEKLLEGKKLTNLTGHSGNYIYFNAEGFLVNEYGNMAAAIYTDFGNWEEYEEFDRIQKIQELKTDKDGVALCKDACNKITELIKAVNKLMEAK